MLADFFNEARVAFFAKQCFPRQRPPAFIDRETRGRLYFLNWSTIMATTLPITTFFQPVKSSEIENETVNGVEAEAGAMEFENGERCFMLLFHFLRNVSDCG